MGVLTWCLQTPRMVLLREGVVDKKSPQYSLWVFVSSLPHNEDITGI